MRMAKSLLVTAKVNLSNVHENMYVSRSEGWIIANSVCSGGSYTCYIVLFAIFPIFSTNT
ncbi:unnamed protein product [Cylicocyclus nassatus]|uniref:Uncharacterized protein n=1 Tax=Cylicocyclus nassatus TaxID=53992 RepID=A0AA36GPZ3_CYLNA|nr:unnamed protein product [Cylicocyclus nassatus]